ncbi:three-helix bundle dimerization domain-containing protein [Plantactinospora sp. KLBMP9567]|uniref:three-helix bundle dimerization domain-containing protein n=1 Tax=Plantactinospora sp. KLBMP9567 TaxID=3085900 RepID=UPI002981705D|nr:hypothetical protein [Plantactinospora sp. KLBMP9567]MDW5330426.1 hypothetical protein [Plantactinospora sp. KLBMP9567]
MTPAGGVARRHRHRGHRVVSVPPHHAGTYGPERVAEAVAAAYARFADARVRSYLPLLVERIVHEELGPSRAARAVSTGGTEGS